MSRSRNWRRHYAYRPPPVPRYPNVNANWRYRTPPLRRTPADWNAYIDRDYQAWFYDKHGRDLPPHLLEKVKRRRLHGKARRPRLKADQMPDNHALAALAERVRAAEAEYKAGDERDPGLAPEGKDAGATAEWSCRARRPRQRSDPGSAVVRVRLR